MERKFISHCTELKGSHYAIGYQLGLLVHSLPPLRERLLSESRPISERKLKRLKDIFRSYCPGLNEELQGFSDANEICSSQVLYYAASCISPGCSQLVLSPKLTENGHVYLVRNYDYFPEMDDWVLCRTMVKGRYAHLGTNIMQFGRGEGINEHGLAIGCSALPPFDKKEFAVEGLQFWAVIRTILENTKNVEEALCRMKEIPIACNANFLLANKDGELAIFESFEGRKAFFRMERENPEGFLAAANHAHLGAMIRLSPFAMKHSVQRMRILRTYLEKKPVSSDRLRSLLLTDFPDGWKMSYYPCSFGTLKSMIFDLNEASLEICWGGLSENRWERHFLGEALPDSEREIKIIGRPCPEDFTESVRLSPKGEGFPLPPRG